MSRVAVQCGLRAGPIFQDCPSVAGVVRRGGSSIASRHTEQQCAVPSGSARRSGVDHFLSSRRKVCVLPSLSPRSNCTHVPAQFELVFQT